MTAAARAEPRYRRLDSAQIIATLARLRDRIAERFPDSGLAGVSRELVVLADESTGVVSYLQRPNWPIRLIAGVAITLMAAVAIGAAIAVRPSVAAVRGLGELLQTVESAINDLVFLAAAAFFLVTLEGRIKRRRALGALHQLRSIVHIVDMHQLTKDPERMLSPEADTPSSPERTMSGPELGRYLDYCSELVALTSKLAALFVQRYDDPVVLSAVNEIETLATGLSGKVWQKITLLDRTARDAALPGR